jgi:DNA-binding response OmpR family regulator
MVTGLSGDSIQKQGHKSGAEYVISKPFDPADILWEIDDVLKKKGDARAA